MNIWDLRIYASMGHSTFGKIIFLVCLHYIQVRPRAKVFKIRFCILLEGVICIIIAESCSDYVGNS